MKNETTKINLEEITHREVTGATNGYPTPVLGVALFAESLDELRELGKKIGLDNESVYAEIAIHEFQWKAGWFNCTDRGEQFDPENYADFARIELEEQDYTSEWDLDSVTEIGYTDDADCFRLGLFIDFSEGWQYDESCKSVEKVPVYECPECGCEWDCEEDATSCCAE